MSRNTIWHELCMNIDRRYWEWREWCDDRHGDGLFVLDRLRLLDRATRADAAQKNDDDSLPCPFGVKSW